MRCDLYRVLFHDVMLLELQIKIKVEIIGFYVYFISVAASLRAAWAGCMD